MVAGQPFYQLANKSAKNMKKYLVVNGQPITIVDDFKYLSSYIGSTKIKRAVVSGQPFYQLPISQLRT